MDERGEAIDGGRGISLKRMLRACSGHCASNTSINNEEPVCRGSGIGQVETIVQDEKGTSCIAWLRTTVKGTWDDSMVDDLILSI